MWDKMWMEAIKVVKLWSVKTTIILKKSETDVSNLWPPLYHGISQSINLYNPFNFMLAKLYFAARWLKWKESEVVIFFINQLVQSLQFRIYLLSVATQRHYHNVSLVMYSWQSDIHLEGWNVEVLHAKLHMLLSFKRGNCEIKGLEHLGIISLLPSIGILTS